jgi:aminoglycoside 3-N-acetyltransferase
VIVRQLHALGVAPGSLVVVHTSFKAVGEGTPDSLIDALLAAVGPNGTLVMPAMSGDDDQVFDPARTDCRGMGVVADTFWRRPGVLRSDNISSFAACGPLAPAVTAPHPLAPPHGIDSPVGRVAALGGKVLLLGVGHSEDTTVHLAECLAAVPYRLRKYATTRDGRVEYDENDCCCARFTLLDEWLGPLQSTGTVGRAPSRLAASADIVRVAVEKLLKDPLIFLHERGCDECAEARATISA